MVYQFAVSVLRPFLKLYYKIKVINLPNPFPSKGLIISGNHSCWVDPAWLSVVVPRHIHYLAKKELFGNCFTNYLFLKAGFFPVDRGQADRKAIKFATKTLNNNEVVGIFPEGTRNKDGVGKAHNGAAYLAIRTGSPILPVSINVSGHKLRSEINITFHDLIEVDKSSMEKAKLELITNKLMKTIESGLSNKEQSWAK